MSRQLGSIRFLTSQPEFEGLAPFDSFQSKRTPRRSSLAGASGGGARYFLRDSLCGVCLRSRRQYFFSSRRSAPRVSFWTR